jgi:type III secretory pathway component EscV
LRRPITHSLTLGSKQLSVYLLDSMIEETIRSAISRTSAGSYLSLAPAAARDIVRAVQRVTSGAEQSGHRPVLLTQPDIRRFVRKLTETDMPALRVISYAELLPEVNVRPVGTATLTDM